MFEPLRDGLINSSTLHLAHAEDFRNHACDQFPVGDGRKVGKPYAVGIAIKDFRSDLQRQSRLPHTTRAEECHELVLAQERLHFFKLNLAATKAAWLNRELVWGRIGPLEGRDLSRQSCDDELPHQFGLRKVLEPMRAKIKERRAYWKITMG